MIGLVIALTGAVGFVMGILWGVVLASIAQRRMSREETIE